MRRAPRRVQDAAAALLADAPAHARELFALRLDRRWQDLTDGLAAVYDDVEPLVDEVVARAARAFLARDPDLARLDQARTLEPDWLSRRASSATRRTSTGSPATCRGCAPGSRTCASSGSRTCTSCRCSTSRPGDDDGGYAVGDYRTVRAELGTTEDLRSLATDLREAGISLVLDLVLNHVAREHPWAVAAREGSAQHRGVLPRLPRPRAAGRLRADPARGLPGLRARQLHLGRRAAGLGLDDVQRLPVGRRLGQPAGVPRVPRGRPVPRQPRRRGAAAGRDRLPLEAAGHRLPEPARGARAHPGAAGRRPHRLPGGGLQGRGDRRAARARALPRQRPAPRQGQRPRVPQQPHGAGLVDARRAGRRARRARAARAAAGAVEHLLGHLPARPRRHRLGDRRRRRRGRRPVRPAAPGVPVRLVRRRSSPARPRAGWCSRRTRRPATGGSAARRPASPGLAAAPGRASRRPTSTSRSARLLLGARRRARLGRRAGAVVRRRAGAAQRPGLGRGAGRTRRTTAGRTGRGCRRTLADRRHDPATVEGRVVRRRCSTCAAVRAGLPHLHASLAAQVLDLSDPAVLPVLRRHPVGPLLALYNVSPGLAAPSRSAASTTPGSPAVGRADRPRSCAPGDDGQLWLAPYAALWLVDEPPGLIRGPWHARRP